MALGKRVDRLFAFLAPVQSIWSQTNKTRSKYLVYCIPCTLSCVHNLTAPHHTYCCYSLYGYTILHDIMLKLQQRIAKTRIMYILNLSICNCHQTGYQCEAPNVNATISCHRALYYRVAFRNIYTNLFVGANQKTELMQYKISASKAATVGQDSKPENFDYKFTSTAPMVTGITEALYLNKPK